MSRETARYTYLHGSRPAGVIVYDEGAKVHVHHDTARTRGQHNAFDFVRLEKFGHLDDGCAPETPITERPSYKAMCEFASNLPEIRSERAGEELTDMGPLPAGETWLETGAHAIDEHQARQAAERVARLGGYRRLGDVLADRRHVEWLPGLRDILERGVLAVLAGPLKTYKSFLANDWAMRVALAGEPVFILSPEGSGLQRRLQAWLDEFAPAADPAKVPVFTRERRLSLSVPEEMSLLEKWLREIESECGKPIACIVIDTLSKSSNHKEDSNDETRALINEVDRRLRHRGAKPATVLIVAHTGHTNQDRARGAYSLVADTDAAYVSSFSGETVTVTRDRFKDAPSLPPLYFTPKARELAYRDPDGNVVKSLVLIPADAPAARMQKLRPEQQELYERVLKRFKLEARSRLTAEEVLDGIKGHFGTQKRSLERLVERGLVMRDGHMYSIPAPIVAGDAGAF